MHFRPKILHFLRYTYETPIFWLRLKGDHKFPISWGSSGRLRFPVGGRLAAWQAVSWSWFPKVTLFGSKNAVFLPQFSFLRLPQKFVTTRPSRIVGQGFSLAGTILALHLLLSKKRFVTDRGIQLTSFGPKNVTLPTGGSNWPFRCLDYDETPEKQPFGVDCIAGWPPGCRPGSFWVQNWQTKSDFFTFHQYNPPPRS